MCRNLEFLSNWVSYCVSRRLAKHPKGMWRWMLKMEWGTNTFGRPFLTVKHPNFGWLNSILVAQHPMFVGCFSIFMVQCPPVLLPVWRNQLCVQHPAAMKLARWGGLEVIVDDMALDMTILHREGKRTKQKTLVEYDFPWHFLGFDDFDIFWSSVHCWMIFGCMPSAPDQHPWDSRRVRYSQHGFGVAGKP